MKIAITGSHGTGKTTISTALSQQLGLLILPDIVVDAHRLGFEINEGTPIETQLWLTAKQLENEKITPNFIADKCIFDYFVYAKALNMDPDLVAILKKIAIKNGKYDQIFYLFPEFPIEDDGLRSTNVEFQNAVHQCYLEFLEGNNIKFTRLSGNIEERTKQALSSHIC